MSFLLLCPYPGIHTSCCCLHILQSRDFIIFQSNLSIIIPHTYLADICVSLKSTKCKCAWASESFWFVYIDQIKMAWINCHDFLCFYASRRYPMYYRSVLLMWMYINCTRANCAQPITALKKNSLRRSRCDW